MRWGWGEGVRAGSGCILKLESIGFPGGQNVGRETRSQG